jgi:hypothetical protein
MASFSIIIKRKLNGLSFFLFMLVVKLILNLIYRSNNTREVYRHLPLVQQLHINLKFGEREDLWQLQVEDWEDMLLGIKT